MRNILVVKNQRLDKFLWIVYLTFIGCSFFLIKDVTLSSSVKGGLMSMSFLLLISQVYSLFSINEDASEMHLFTRCSSFLVLFFIYEYCLYLYLLESELTTYLFIYFNFSLALSFSFFQGKKTHFLKERLFELMQRGKITISPNIYNLNIFFSEQEEGIKDDTDFSFVYKFMPLAIFIYCFMKKYFPEVNFAYDIIFSFFLLCILYFFLFALVFDFVFFHFVVKKLFKENQ